VRKTISKTQSRHGQPLIVVWQAIYEVSDVSI